MNIKMTGCIMPILMVLLASSFQAQANQQNLLSDEVITFFCEMMMFFGVFFVYLHTKYEKTNMYVNLF